MRNANLPAPAPVRRKIRCAIYTRVSVESQDDISSCDVQFELCSAYIRSLRSLGLELIEERFSDDGLSGATLERPALLRLLEVVRSRGIDRLVIYRLDRLTRNLRHFTTLFEELKNNDVELDVATAPETGAAALDTLMLNILASFSEFERDLAATRIAESRAHLKSHGRRIAGATPFGYNADPRTKQLVVCAEKAEAIRRMFTLADQGLPPSAIAAFGNAQGWVTGSGSPWTARQVLAILTNHTYAGMVEHQNSFYEGCHQALIDRELYYRVQDRIAGGRTAAPRKNANRVTRPWVLRGILICENCGRPMGTHTVRFGPLVRLYYRCRSTAGGREACKGVMINAGEVEMAVLKEIGEDMRMVSREQTAKVKEALRSVSYNAAERTLKFVRIEPPRESI